MGCPGRPWPSRSGWWALQTVCLQGRLTGLGGEDLPTIVIVAHYDAFGVAPVSMCVPGAEGSSCLWLVGRKETQAKGKGARLGVREPRPTLAEPSPRGHTDRAEFPPRDGPPSRGSQGPAPGVLILVRPRFQTPGGEQALSPNTCPHRVGTRAPQPQCHQGGRCPQGPVPRRHPAGRLCLVRSLGPAQPCLRAASGSVVETSTCFLCLTLRLKSNQTVLMAGWLCSLA